MYFIQPYQISKNTAIACLLGKERNVFDSHFQNKSQCGQAVAKSEHRNKEPRKVTLIVNHLQHWVAVFGRIPLSSFDTIPHIISLPQVNESPLEK